jgi:hypothetical protein
MHDFHTSWMNITHNEAKKVLETNWTTDLEHLEFCVSEKFKTEIVFEKTHPDAVNAYLNAYLHEHTELRLNGKKQKLEVAFFELNITEITVHFKPIKCRRPLKTLAMQNTLLLKEFPNQKNMVQLNYKGKMYSMLLGKEKPTDQILVE